ncbi:hypothetical protein CYJ10_26510 [Cupriavidus pauculus]|uniref:Uncharacterized protein n=1 Tax=Cupriavidus pauculus TaxID=82633 RepID=A0A2N5C5A6_9BURK|nr:hypothetical protein CYJ10_26510 [Cupriavidus pauculus]
MRPGSGGGLFGIEWLEPHARSRRGTIRTGPATQSVLLQRRLDANASDLMRAYRASAAELQSGRSVEPAAASRFRSSKMRHEIAVLVNANPARVG